MGSSTAPPPSWPAGALRPAFTAHPWRGLPQAFLLLALLALGGVERSLDAPARELRFWLFTVALTALTAALPSIVHALRDPAHGPARSDPPLSRRDAMLATATALGGSALVATAIVGTTSTSLVGCGVVLVPFLLAASRLALRWIGALARSLEAGAVHRGAHLYRVTGVDPAAGALALEARDGRRVVASWPHDPRLPLDVGALVRAHIEPRGDASPYRDAPAAVLTLETERHRRLRLRDRAGIAVALFRALAWAALPLAFVLGRALVGHGPR